MPHQPAPLKGGRRSATARATGIPAHAGKADKLAATSTSHKSVLLVRHGATTATHQRCFVGATDSPLSCDGRRQAQALGEVIEDFAPDACLCSPLLRCQQTASLLLPTQALAAVAVPDLRELDFGAWEGRTYEEIACSDPQGLARMMRFDPDYAPGGGELLGWFLARVKSAARLITLHPAEKILVVTHGGVIRALLCILLDLDLHKQFHAFEIAPASVAELMTFDGGAVLRRLLPSPQGKEGNA